MEKLITLLLEHRFYVFLGIGLAVALFFGRLLLNRPTREERNHRRRYDQLKQRHRDKYRHLRPPR